MKNKSISNYISISQPRAGHQSIRILSDSGRAYHLQVPHKDMKAFDKYIRKAKLGMSYKEILREELIKYINGSSSDHGFFNDKGINFSDITPEGQTVVGLKGKSTVLLQAALPDAESMVLEGAMMPLQNISTRTIVADAGEEKIVSKDELELVKQAGFASTQRFFSQLLMQDIPEVLVSHVKPVQAAETRMIKMNQEQGLASSAFEKNQADIKSLTQMFNQRAAGGGLTIKLPEMANSKQIKRALLEVHPDHKQGQNSSTYHDLSRILSEMLNIQNREMTEVNEAGAIQLAIEGMPEVAQAEVSSTSVPTSHQAEVGAVSLAQEIAMIQQLQTSSSVPSHSVEAGESKQEGAKSKASNAKLKQPLSTTKASGAVDQSTAGSPSQKSVPNPLMSLGAGAALLATGAVALGAVAAVRNSAANTSRGKVPAAENIAPPPANKPALAKQTPVAKKVVKLKSGSAMHYFRNM